MIACLFYFYYFFFKQKTAYERRISDWSSDVCSSDLGPLTVEATGTDSNGNPVTGTDTGALDAVPGTLTVDLGDTSDPTQVPITGTTADVLPGSTDRKSVVWGKSVSVRVDRGWRSIR